MGAGKWRDEYAKFLTGRKVVIVPDNDQAGRDHAQAEAKSLQGKAASVKMLTLSGLPEKGDVSDWLGLGGTKGQSGNPGGRPRHDTLTASLLAKLKESAPGADDKTVADCLALTRTFPTLSGDLENSQLLCSPQRKSRVIARLPCSYLGAERGKAANSPSPLTRHSLITATKSHVSRRRPNWRVSFFHRSREVS